MKVLQDFDRPAHLSCYGVAGRLLFIETFDARLTTVIGTLFDGWLLDPIPSTQQKPDVTVRFFSCDRLPDVPQGLEQFEIADGGRCFTDGNSFYLVLGNSVLFVDQEVADHVTVSLWTNNVPDLPDAELASATSFAVCSGLRRHGLFDLHAAGVVHPESEHALLVIGPSGSGKSTLTLQLVQSGWRYLSDDELLLNVLAGQVEARGFRRFFAITETTAGACATGGLSVVHANDKMKICFDPAAQFPAQYAVTSVPRWLCFTEITDADESRINQLTQTEAMTRLIRSCPWATYDRAIAGGNLNLLSLLARQTRAFTLKAGRDLLQSSRAAELLAAQVREN